MAHSERFAVHKGPAGEIDVRGDRGMAVVSDNGERGDEHGARASDGAASSHVQLWRQLTFGHITWAGARTERQYSRQTGTLLADTQKF